MLILVVVLFSTNRRLSGAEFDTSYAMLVDEKQLPPRNGMMQTIWSLSGVISPAIAAALIALPSLARRGSIGGSTGALLASLSDGTPLAIGLDVFSYLLAAVVPLFLLIPSPQREDLEKPKSMWADMREGAVFVWRRSPMLWLLGTYTMANLVIAFSIIQRPLLVKFNLAPDWGARGYTFETAYALLSSIGSMGGIAGGFLISTWGGLRKRRIYGILGPMIVTGFAMVIYGFSPWLYLTAVAAALWSAMIPILNSHSQSIWQSVTPRELQGRVFSVRRVIGQFSIPLGTLLGGSAGGFFDPGISMAIGGGLMVVYTITQLFNPFLMRIEDKEYMDSLGESSHTADTQPVRLRKPPGAVEKSQVINQVDTELIRGKQPSQAKE